MPVGSRTTKAIPTAGQPKLGGRIAIRRCGYWIVVLLVLLAFAPLSCGSSSDSDSDGSSAGRYRFVLQSESTISTSDGDEEELQGSFTVSTLDLCCNYYFALRIEALDLRSKSFLIAGMEGVIVARTILTLGVSAPVEMNGQDAQLTGGGGPSTYFEGGRLEQIPKRFRGVILRTDDDVKLTIFASR